MINLDALLGQTVYVELAGKVCKTGYLIDYGDDLFVIYDGRQYVYIPFLHTQLFTKNTLDDIVIQPPDPAQIGNQTPKITLRDMLTNATGQFLELWATGRQPLHGTLAHLQGDYLMFDSPVYKTMYVSLDHVKWFIPFTDTQLPYATPLPLSTSTQDLSQLAPTFTEQVQRMVGHLVVLDVGDTSEKIGTLVQFNPNGMLELITAAGDKMYFNLHHLKTIHAP